MRELDQLVERIKALADEQILLAREAGDEWWALGSSKQQAQQRWKRVEHRQRELTERREAARKFRKTLRSSD